MKNKLVLVLVIIFMLLPGCTLTDGNNVNECKSKTMTMEEDSRVRAMLIDSTDKSANSIKKSGFAMGELEKLEFGFQFIEDSKQAYLAYELCDQDMDTAIIPPQLVKSENNLFYVRKGDKTQSPIITAPFIYTNAKGEEENYIDIGGNYAVNVYIATPTEDWKWVSTFEFHVTK